MLYWSTASVKELITNICPCSVENAQACQSLRARKHKEWMKMHTPTHMKRQHRRLKEILRIWDKATSLSKIENLALNLYGVSDATHDT